MAELERIPLGSGKVYVTEFIGNTIPEDAVIETESNLIGKIKNGASIEYKPEYYTATDDLGLVSKTKLIKEEASLKCGVMTIISTTFERLCSTARKTYDAVKKRTTVKIGGVANDDGKQYVIRFVNEDAQDGDTRITIVGRNQSGFTLAFAQDKETVIDAEFKALPNDVEGTLIIIDLDDPETTSET